ncbi:DUF1360 domain-containing protein [Saccharothrix algeriensis]|uniref:DUF1360 domain-containing protein n=1 Tax=Saccharothrix algeriensis TaxID=173560 RepID=A0A8T8I5Q4_9PSEU|nr:DUF1360 domain-containing protein [Saccharothrix algeriensis]MBM7809971.1 hypothetical protein [Saccharothrix algeriensis]QTR05971.1 DUF1360 domain-containing protein [Saccharothrix algeriensis]
MSIAAMFDRVRSAYSGEADRPLGGYLAAMGTYAGLVGVAVAVGRRRGARLPERLSAGDIALLAVATHKSSRLLTKSAVGSAVRAPFTRYEEPAGLAEVNESVRGGSGVRHSVGELVSCPFCSGVWIAGALTAGLVLAPRASRLVAGALAAVAGSDWLHLGYDLAKRAAQD